MRSSQICGERLAKRTNVPGSSALTNMLGLDTSEKFEVVLSCDDIEMILLETNVLQVLIRLWADPDQGRERVFCDYPVWP